MLIIPCIISYHNITDIRENIKNSNLCNFHIHLQLLYNIALLSFLLISVVLLLLFIDKKHNLYYKYNSGTSECVLKAASDQTLVVQVGKLVGFG